MQQTIRTLFSTGMRTVLTASALVFGAGVFVAGAPAPASAQSLDDGHASIFDAIRGRLSSGIGLDLGSRGDERERIDYRERAPLVIPPKLELREPIPPVSQRNAAWPADYDRARVQRARQGALAGASSGDGRGGMTAHEIRTIGRLQANRPRNPVTEQCDGGVGSDGQVCDPNKFWSIMKNTRKEGDNRDVIAGQEPERRRLTDPPAGYRAAKSTQKYTFDVKEKVELGDPRAQYREELRRQNEVD